MADPGASPISQLLHTLGITREELVKHSVQMRQFLTADDALSSRVSDRETLSRPRSGSDLPSSTRSVGPTRTLARSLSRASSSSQRDVTPPSTPVKTEPLESTLPHRRMDSMEMVIERQRRQRKTRRDRDREPSRNRQHPPSPSPSNASYSGHSQDSMASTRDETNTCGPILNDCSTAQHPESVPVAEPPPVTPQKNKYYREHTNLSAHSQALKDATCKNETPTPTRPVMQPILQSQPLPPYYAYPAYVGYPHYLPVAYRPMQAGTPSATLPTTPQAQRIHIFPPTNTTAVPSSLKAAASPLPPSSPPPASSPMSSPSRRVVNLVSSPGPMGPEPEETEYDNLPYKLPPGPYLSTKPDLSYAALIGRAILSSPEHRLTLQEIYDWITIVYPYYKRGETTWMNSIRHVLSTTLVFRKVPRDRSVGRTLWAIYNDDIECFRDGGFKKHLCKDYSNGADGKDKGGGMKGKGGRARKRTADDDDAERKPPKKARKDQLSSSNTSGDSSVVHSSFIPLGMHPLFPPRATPHLQPYYQSLMPQPQTQTFPPVPTDVIFPPLPATAFSRIASTASSSSSVSKGDDASIPSTTTSATTSPPPSSTSESSPPPSTVISSSASSSALSSASSVPELTPHRTSSSPPSSLPATSDLDIDMRDSRVGTRAPGDDVLCTIASTVIAKQDAVAAVDPEQEHEDEADAIFNTTLLGPVKFWKDTNKTSGGLQPGIELMDFEDERDLRVPSARDKKGKKKDIGRKHSIFPPIQTSPTLNVRRLNQPKPPIERPTTPISSASSCPATPPPRNGSGTTTTHKISSIRTPISHKGLHMSPSPSLAHFKSHLDPPPTVSGGVAPLDVSHPSGPEDEPIDPTRTPRKRTTNALNGGISVFGHPVTPKKLVFSTSDASPFRTPVNTMGGAGGTTPRSRAMYDPHDPRTLLDDELQRMSSYDGESPAGLFGKERSSLLYDSPGLEGYKWW
ncbi:hypothetical protein CPB83DRAFT_897286 [Crepidotus variabilis]|uniref:Fork-head domain-containing protein n=1 Tax=Crepidotus variabilis TaxID=179855 RepID=A0A9P6E9V2_9AGAR|nr:hypothetical protein CPB83DRAFT_897286 [Crepidotus variabilis]